MKNNYSERSVCIPIKIVDGEPRLLAGEPLPAIKEGSIGDLIVSLSAFKDPAVAATFSTEERVELLKKDTRLLAQVSPKSIPSDLRQSAQHNVLGLDGPAVEFALLEAQDLLKRGTKNAELCPCRCSISSLKEEAISINHAYTLISQRFEPHRKSHSGNVFLKVYYYDGKFWRPLKDLRGY